MKAISKSLKKNDPNHLNLGIRYGYIEQLDDELLRISKESFDSFEFQLLRSISRPRKNESCVGNLWLPMIIREYHFGTVDRGLAQSLWQVNSQKERGDPFRYYTENAFAHRGLIGTGWFRWIDQNINGRTDGRNYNCGFIDVTDGPYPYMVDAAIETAKSLYEIHSGTKTPFHQAPNAMGTLSHTQSLGINKTSIHSHKSMKIPESSWIYFFTINKNQSCNPRFRR